MKKLGVILGSLLICANAFGAVQTDSLKLKDAEGEIATVSGSFAANRAITVPDAAGTLALTTSNVSTASALAANGANCGAGEYPLGVGADGAAESCTDATTEISSYTASNYVPLVYEGTADDFETTLAFADPTTPDKTITFPDLTGTVALSANKLSFFAATTSAELTGVLSDEDGSGTCGSGAICIGGHTHPTTEVSGVNAGTDLTVDLEEEDHASEHAVSAADTVFPADPNADRYLMWDDDPGALTWAEVSGGAFDATTVDAPTWSDGANASNIWTFDLSGTDPTLTFASGLITAGGDLTSTGTITAAVGFDCTGAADCDYGSADITDHTFVTDGTGDGEIVLPNDSIGAAEITADAIEEQHLKAVDAASDEECLTYEATTGDFEWQACGSGSGSTVLNLPIYSAKLTGAFVVFTPPAADACTAGAQIDAGDGNWRLLFDATADECATWQFVVPDNYSSTPKLDIFYTMASGTANEIEFEAAIMCVSDNDGADIGTASFSNVAVISETVDGTVGDMQKVTVTLTDDSCAAGDVAFIVLSTDADDATADDATGDREVVGVQFDYA